MKLTLVEKRDEAKGTKSFFWQSEKPVNYLPGQYYYYSLPALKYPDPRGITRHFTISSSPSEGAILRLTTHIREESGFKKTLDELTLGATIEGEGPSGTFILDSSQPNLQVFLAGGIGITPFRPFIKYAIDKKLATPMALLYSNSHTEEIAFKKELEAWAKINPNFKLYMTVSKPEESLAAQAGKDPWNGLTGRIDAPFIQKVLSKDQISSATFWVCGPPAMVDAMETNLSQMGISSDHVKIEKFTGY